MQNFNQYNWVITKKNGNIVGIKRQFIEGEAGIAKWDIKKCSRSQVISET